MPHRFGKAKRTARPSQAIAGLGTSTVQNLTELSGNLKTKRTLSSTKRPVYPLLWLNRVPAEEAFTCCGPKPGALGRGLWEQALCGPVGTRSFWRRAGPSAHDGRPYKRRGVDAGAQGECQAETGATLPPAEEPQGAAWEPGTGSPHLTPGPSLGWQTMNFCW